MNNLFIVVGLFSSLAIANPEAELEIPQGSPSSEENIPADENFDLSPYYPESSEYGRAVLFSWSPERFRVSPSLRIGPSIFGLDLKVSYYLYKYLAIDTSLYYINEKDAIDQDRYETHHMGPSVDLVIYAENPTLFVPYGGLGSGYEFWSREFAGEVYDENSAFVGRAFLGAELRLSAYFGVRYRYLIWSYINAVPISYEDRRQDIEKPSTSHEFSFYFSI